jgi:hypothetical protein
MKCNKEELRPPGAAPRGPRKNQRPRGKHRPHPPGRPEPASQEPRKQPPATDTRTLRVSAYKPWTKGKFDVTYCFFLYSVSTCM